MATDPRILEDKRTYHEKMAKRANLPPFTDQPSDLKLDRDLGRVTAHAFNDLPHNPNDPRTRQAYDALKWETRQQYDHLVGRGVHFEPWTAGGQPYKDSADMARDARDNRHLYYFPSRSGFGTDDRFKDHPLMEQVPGMPEGTVYNDLFRAVHDWFAHAMHGHQFGPQGELRAWHEHARMYSPLARKALTTETHGQNSWVNFGPHLRGDESPTQKPFADQKAGILPEHTHPPVKLARRVSINSLPPGYWIDPDGREHYVGNTMMHEQYLTGKGLFHNQEDAYAAGWHKVNVMPHMTLAYGARPLTGKQKETLGIIAIRHGTPEAQHLTRGEVEPKKIKLARPKKQPDHPEEAAFKSTLWKQWQAWRKHLADNERRGRPDVTEGAPDVMDDTARLVFADWLAERGDPREHIVRQHVNRNKTAAGAGRGHALTFPTHPEHPAGLEPNYYNLWTNPPVADRPIIGAHVPAGEKTWDFRRDLIHPGRAQYADKVTGGWNRSNGKNYPFLPTVVWRHAGITTSRRGSDVQPRDREHPLMFHAPVTFDQYFQIADSMPEQKRKEWYDLAEYHGWPRPTKGPTRLARLTVSPPSPRKTFGGDVMNHHTIHDESGNQVGHVTIAPRNEGRHLHVEWIGRTGINEAADERQANTLGPEGMRSVLHGLAEHYPNAEYVSGKRISGYRAATGEAGDRVVVRMPRVRLARPVAVVTGRGAAVRQQGSDNHEAKLAVARQVLSEAGLRATVKSVLAHDGNQSRPAVAAQAVRASDPQHALFAAAWLGLLTQQPAVTVFEPGEGQDALHVIDSPHPQDMVADYLRKSGMKQFTTEQRPTGTRVYAVNPDADVATLARGIHGQHSQFNGRADRIGGGAGSGPTSRSSLATARAGYRTVIRDAERAAGYSTGPAS